MAVPKKRTSKQRKRKRRTHYKAEPVTVDTCPKCGDPKRAASGLPDLRILPGRVGPRGRGRVARPPRCASRSTRWAPITPRRPRSRARSVPSRSWSRTSRSSWSETGQVIEAELAKHPRRSAGRLHVHHASERVTASDAPASVLRRKPDSSIVVGLKLVQTGEADAFVSAGSTGAVMATSLFTLRPLPGVARPAIGTILPTAASPCLMLDAGANVDCKPQHLVQFAHLGHIYAQDLMGVERAPGGAPQHRRGAREGRRAHPGDPPAPGRGRRA